MKLLTVINLVTTFASLGKCADGWFLNIDPADIEDLDLLRNWTRDALADSKVLPIAAADGGASIAERDEWSRACNAACNWKHRCANDGYYLDLGPTGSKLFKDGTACIIWQDFAHNYPAWEGDELQDGKAAIVGMTKQDGWGKSFDVGRWRSAWANELTTAFKDNRVGTIFAQVFDESQTMDKSETDPMWHVLAGAETVRWGRNRDAALIWTR